VRDDKDIAGYLEHAAEVAASEGKAGNGLHYDEGADLEHDSIVDDFVHGHKSDEDSVCVVLVETRTFSNSLNAESGPRTPTTATYAIAAIAAIARDCECCTRRCCKFGYSRLAVYLATSPG
jgi:hypothetical protein